VVIGKIPSPPLCHLGGKYEKGKRKLKRKGRKGKNMCCTLEVLL
jgi:hypothetical protein